MNRQLTLRHWNSLFFSIGTLIIVLSLVVIYGWLTSNPALVQIHPQFASMKFNTALGFLLSGSCLILLRLKRETWVRAISILLSLLALISLTEWILELDLGIDNLFVTDTIKDPTAPLGRMSVPTALCFMFSAAAFLLFSLRRGQAQLITLVSVLGGIILAIGIIGLIDYVLSVFTDYGWQQFTVMAVHTTSSFCFIGASLILLAVLENDRKGLNFGTEFIPVATVLLMFCLSISIAIENKNREHASTLLSNQLSNQLEQIKLDLNFFTTTLTQAARRWEILHGKASQQEWQADSRLYLETLLALKVMGRIDAFYTPVWLVADEPSVGLSDLNSVLRDVINAPSQTARINYVNTDRFKQQLVFTIPLYVDNQFDGFILALFDVPQVFGKIAGVDFDQLTWLVVTSGLETIYSNVDQADIVEDDFTLTQQATFHGLQLQFRSGYLQDSPVHGVSLLSSTVFISGSLFVCVLFAAIYAYQRSRVVMGILSNEKERFRQVIEAAPGAMLLASESGKIEFLNTKTEHQGKITNVFCSKKGHFATIDGS